MTAQQSHERTFLDEYFELDYRKAVKGRFLRSLPGRLGIGYYREVRIRNLHSGYWRGFNALDPSDWRKRKAWKAWRAKWGL